MQYTFAGVWPLKRSLLYYKFNLKNRALSELMYVKDLKDTSLFHTFNIFRLQMQIEKDII